MKRSFPRVLQRVFQQRFRIFATSPSWVCAGGAGLVWRRPRGLALLEAQRTRARAALVGQEEGFWEKISSERLGHRAAGPPPRKTPAVAPGRGLKSLFVTLATLASEPWGRELGLGRSVSHALAVSDVSRPYWFVFVGPRSWGRNR